MPDKQDFFDKYRYLIAVVFIAIVQGGVYIISLKGVHAPAPLILDLNTATKAQLNADKICVSVD